jgi:C4-dicarboxylate-specific signal transduction histidine kinase
MSSVQKTPSDRSAQKAIWVWGYVVALAAMWTLAVGGVLTGELRGGISVAVPLDRFREEARAEALLRAEHYGLLWLVGLVGIVLGGRRLQPQARRRLGVEQELREARDLLEQRVAERTADLEQTNERLRDQIAERQRAEEEARSAQQRLLEHQQRQKELAEAELARLQDQLVRQTQLATIGRVSASIAHELRNPLGAVRNAAYLLKRKLPRDQTRLQEYLRMIEEETSRADLIITELMAMTRGRAPHREPSELGKIVAAARQRCAAPAQFQWSSTYDPDPLLVNVDAAQLEQVFRNLFTNAIHAAGASGWVSIEARRRESLDEILVTDSGPGIASNLRRQVFEQIGVIDGPRGVAFRIRLLHDAKQAEDPS